MSTAAAPEPTEPPEPVEPVEPSAPGSTAPSEPTPEPSSPGPAPASTLAASPSDAVRCSDADRELVATVVSTAYADGRITHQEHDERLEAVWQARTFGELRPLTADLTSAHAVSELAAPGQALVVGAGPAAGLSSPDRITSVLGSVRRDGLWHLRRTTTGIVVLGEARLDLSQARLEAPECVVAVPVVLGELTLRIPAGVGVRDETTSIMGDVKIRGVEAEPGSPTIVLRGLVLMGSVTVTGPGHTGLAERLGLARPNR